MLGKPERELLLDHTECHRTGYQRGQQQLLSDFRVTENDLFDYLGMEHNRNGDLLGWDTDTTMEMETFYDSKLDEDGMPCLVLDYRTPPKWLGY